MPIATCPTCQISAEIPAEFLGKRIRCRACGGELMAPKDAREIPTIDMPARLPGPVHPVAVPVAKRQTKECPYCGEVILAQAVKCKHCGEFLDAVMRSATVVSPPPAPVEPQPVYLPYEEWRARSKPRPQVIQQNVIVKVGSEYRVPHLIHLLLTLCTAGLWLPIWVIHSLLNARRA